MKRKSSLHKWRNLPAGDKAYLAFVYLFLALFVTIVIYPLLYVISCSFSSPEALIQGRVFFLPVEPGIQGYEAVFSNARVWSGYANTILYTATGTALGTSVSMIAAYVLSRREFPVRGFLTIFFMVTMFICGGTIPMYLWLKNLKMLNTIWAIVVPGAVSVWLVIVARTFIQSTIPEELFEATSLDGGSYLQYLFHFIVIKGPALLICFYICL